VITGDWAFPKVMRLVSAAARNPADADKVSRARTANLFMSGNVRAGLVAVVGTRPFAAALEKGVKLIVIVVSPKP
jgi:hypothetical protein